LGTFVYKYEDKGRLKYYGKPIAELWSMLPAMLPVCYTVTWHLTQVDALRLNPSQTAWYSIYYARKQLDCFSTS